MASDRSSGAITNGIVGRGSAEGADRCCFGIEQQSWPYCIPPGSGYSPIIGAGPAGMFLALLLRSLGIECIVVEQRDRAYVESRVRAGVLEQTALELMHRLGVGERVVREGLVHRGTNLAIDGRLFHLDFAALTAGKTVTGSKRSCAVSTTPPSNAVSRGCG